MDLFNGYKTYIVGACTILFGICGLVIGKLDGGTAMTSVLLGFGMLTGRHGLAKAFEDLRYGR